MQIKNILLVEVNPKDAELTKIALDENNFANQIDWVRDGVEALEYLKAEGKFKNRKPVLPAVILLDLQMPRMDGIEFLTQIKNDAVLKTVPVVMLTSSRLEEDLVKSYSLGVNAYVVKPIDLEDFINAIKQLGIFWVIINEVPTKNLPNG